jgi:hypothetical protein
VARTQLVEARVEDLLEHEALRVVGTDAAVDLERDVELDARPRPRDHTADVARLEVLRRRRDDRRCPGPGRHVRDVVRDVLLDELGVEVAREDQRRVAPSASPAPLTWSSVASSALVAPDRP